MRNHFWKLACAALAVSLGCTLYSNDDAGETFPLKIESSLDPAPVFWQHPIGSDHSEGVAVADLNGDGKLDVTSGAYWYEAPDWTRRKYREAGIDGEFVVDCGEFMIDVDEDGDLDLVSAGWQEDGFFWYENPGSMASEWQKHRIADSLHTEGMWRADIDGDGKDEVVAVHYTAQEVFYVTFAGGEPRKVHVGGEEGDEHGVGVGDVDGDGKPDIVTVKGWYRQETPTEWEWKPEFELGDTGFGIQVYDVNADGRSDLIFGRGHSYGLFWMEQTQEGGTRGWKQHLIDGSTSQLHNVALVDLTGDGQPEILTGKRYRGHNGRDPGGYDPLAIYYYTLDRQTQTFTRHPVAYNSGAGVGTQFVVRDMDGDGDVDIVTAGKSGQYWFENLKVNQVPVEQREKEVLLNKDWPFSE
ncbi:MAG: VCBS repeat-containing protein [Acidobacteria bacterium]|nr:VCBS repeat-containing protein [Acidobacteriota bacterium]